MKAKLTFKVLIGPPCCGKSTWVERHASDDELVFSLDRLIIRNHPDISYNEAYRICNWKEIEKEFKATLLQAIKDKKQSIIVDKTNMTSKSRRKLLATVPDDYTKIAVVFNWNDIDALKERSRLRDLKEGKYISDKVIDQMIESFVPIRKDEEGFDKVIQVK